MDNQVDFVASTVIDYLKQHNTSTVSLVGDVQVIAMPWSGIYILPLQIGNTTSKIVAKLSRHPKQKNTSESWEDDDLIDRGLREYDSLSKIYAHFQVHGDHRLQAIRPIIFLRSINAIVMDFFDGQYLIEKWTESLETLDDKLSGKLPTPMLNIIYSTLINPTFTKIIKRWMQRLLST